MMVNFPKAFVLLMLLSSTCLTQVSQAQTVPAPAGQGQKIASTTATSSQDSDPTIAGMDAEASQALVQRLVVLIADTKAHPDKRARGCEYLSQFGPYGASAVPAIKQFIEHQLTTGTLKYHFQRKPSSVIVYPDGTATRIAKAVHAIGEIGPVAADAVPLLRKVAATAILETKPPTETNAPTPRALAAEAIGKVGHSEAVEILIAITNNDPNADTRTGAVKGLARLATSSDSHTSMTAQSQLKVVAVTDLVDAIRDQATNVLNAQSAVQVSRAVAGSARVK